MAEINQQATVNIEVNSESAKRKIAELENKLTDLNKKKKEFEKSGDTSGLVKTEKAIEKVNRQMNNARTNAQKVEAALQKLNSASPKELRMTLKQLQNDLNYIERGSKAWDAHVATIKRVKAEINAVDSELKEHKSLMSQIKDGVNSWGMTIASAAAALTGLTMTARQAVEAFADMDAEMANVRKFTGMTAEEVDALNEEFKKMDTRTSREELNKLAQEAGRLGLQTKEDVLGFVKAADVINVALDDLGEGATLTLSKLTDIFGDKMKYGVEESMLKVGSVINELSQNCTASAPYLANFAQRLAGVGAQAKMTIPEIMGFAAVLDANGQQLEMSATAVSQLIMKMFKDPAKIAKATGMDLQEFNRVLKEDTNQALIMLLEQLNSLGNIDVLAPVFAAMGTDGARASQVIAALAGNVGMVKQQQEAANRAFKAGTSVLNEFAVQNNTVKANLDKAKKGFNEVAIALGQKLAPLMKHVISGTSSMMRAMMSLIKFCKDYAGTIISLTVAMTAYTVAVNASVIADKIKILWNEKVIASFKSLWKVIVSNPYAALAAAIGIVVGLIIDLTRRTDELTLAEETLNDVRTEAAKKASEEESEIRILMSAANDMTLSYEQQKNAVDQLNKKIPGFNGNINAQTRAFTYSKTALDNYINSLIRLYEVEGAREKFKELGKQRAELRAQEVQIQEQIRTEEARQREQNQQIASNPYNYSTTSTGTTPAVVHIRMSDSGALQSLRNQLSSVQSKIRGTDNAMKALQDMYGKDWYLQDAGKPATPQSTITGGGGGGGSHGGSAGGGGGGHGSSAADRKAQEEEKKRQQEEEKRKRQQAIMEKKEFKDAFDLAKAQRTNANNAALESYQKGEIDYKEYLKKLYDAGTEYYESVDKLFEKYDLKDSDEMAKIHQKQLEEAQKYYNDLKELRLDEIADERDARSIQAEMDFYDQSNQAAYRNEEYRQDKLALIQLEYLQKVLGAQQEGTKEYYDAERAYIKAVKEEEYRQQVQLEEKLQQWLLTYNLLGAKDRKTAELAVLDALYEQKKIKEEQYQQAKVSIEKKYRDMVDEETGTLGMGRGFAKATRERDEALAKLEEAKNQGLLDGEKDYQQRRWQIIKSYHDQIKGLVSAEGNDWSTMVMNLVDSWKSAFENLGSNLADILKSISDMTEATFAIMGAALESWSNYSNAQRDLEVANVTKSYDEKIKAAGNNDKKSKKLEEQKQKEIAKIKSKYNKRAQAIEMAQAISSTAMAAINAYASAAQVPMIGYIIAPIAASLALAAGALQIATIKKQHQAEAAGYYEGGFTSRDANNYREVGVVHANEFVANHKAVENPSLMPVLRLIDQAQKNNTVGSLTADDVSRALGQGAVLGEMTASNRTAALEREANMALVAAAMEQQSAAIVELNRRLEQGIESFMVMDGERGFEKYWENYQALKERPRR